jgi:hypothetical protein
MMSACCACHHDDMYLAVAVVCYTKKAMSVHVTQKLRVSG